MTASLSIQSDEIPLFILAHRRRYGRESRPFHYIRSGRLSAIARPTGERGIDVAKLIRVFGPLSRLSHPETATESRAIRPSVAPILPVVAPHDALVELLQEQLSEAKEREYQARLEKDRLLIPFLYRFY